MLFDLGGKRKRFIQAIYLSLAVLMGGGLVLFGIGGEVSGGLLDGLGIGGQGTSQSADFDKRADRLERRARANPKDTRLQLEIARTRYLAGNAAAERDGETGATSFTEESTAQFEQAAAAWEDYLKLTENPSANVAIFMSTAYAVLNDAKGAARAQAIVVEARPSPTSLFELARYRYFAGDFEGGDKARDRAAKLADRQQDGTGKELAKQLGEVRTQAKEFVKAQKERGKADPNAPNPFETPLSGGGLDPQTPAVP